MKRDGNIQKNFWAWFLLHEEQFFNFDGADEPTKETLFEMLSEQLAIVDPDLTFEFGPRESRREFVISAGGIKEAFPSVISLLNHAPELGRWDLIAFRPRRPVGGCIRLGGRQVDAKDVQFTLLQNGNMIGISLFIPDYREDDMTFKEIVYLLLDEALGSTMWSPDLDSSRCRQQTLPKNGSAFPYMSCRLVSMNW